MAGTYAVDSFLRKKEENLGKVDKASLEELYDSLYPGLDNSVAICLGGEGRSRSASLIGMRYSATSPNVRIFTSDDTLMPGSSIPKSFENLRKKGYGKFTYIAASGSGNTTNPKTDMEDIENYLARGGLPVKMDLITSTPRSQMQEIVENNGGNIFILPGRSKESETLKNMEYLAYGNQGDLFETEVVELNNFFTLGILKVIEPSWFSNFYNDSLSQMKERHQKLNEIRNTEAYDSLINVMTDPSIDIHSFAQNVGNETIKFNNVRLGHARSYISEAKRRQGRNGTRDPQNKVYGESDAPPITKNSAVIIVSKSFDRRIPKYMEKVMEKGVPCFILTKYGEPDYGHVFKIGGDRFYPDVCTLLTCANIDALERVIEQGVPEDFPVTGDVMKYFHADDKLRPSR